MDLRLYNTLTRRKERFDPVDPGHVRVYVCGPTVYDYAHIGNARPVVVFDVLYRLLKRLYPRVTYVRNITDVDDKIIAAAQESGEDIAAITARFTEAFHQDMAALGALPPDVEPRATDHIKEMKKMIKRLIDSGHAYVADDHVVFDVPSWAEYGRLSRHDRDELIAGARVEPASYKRNPADFVLWKPAAAGEPGWDSEWGKGRPGWHLECSAMSEKHLGETFDIHGGGQDLIFPHHENEIAQSTCAHGGAEFVRVWMHNGYVTVEGEKMSKSLGNFFTVRQLLNEGWAGETLRWALLKAHYRQPLDISESSLRQAKAELDGFYTSLRIHEKVPAVDTGVPDGVMVSLTNDLDIPAAIAKMHDIRVDLNNEWGDVAELKGKLLAAGGILGVLQHDPEAWRKGDAHQVEWIDEMIEKRAEARRNKDFEQADRIRKDLGDKGIVLEDRPDGTTDWRRA